MKQITRLAAVLVLSSVSAWAAQKSVTLTIPGMTCPTCPVTIKQSLLKDKGVSDVKVLYDKKQLVVAYDDAKTTPAAIARATADVGFPSQIVGQ